MKFSGEDFRVQLCVHCDMIMNSIVTPGLCYCDAACVDVGDCCLDNYGPWGSQDTDKYWAMLSERVESRGLIHLATCTPYLMYYTDITSYDFVAEEKYLIVSRCQNVNSQSTRDKCEMDDEAWDDYPVATTRRLFKNQHCFTCFNTKENVWVVDQFYECPANSFETAKEVYSQDISLFVHFIRHKCARAFKIHENSLSGVMSTACVDDTMACQAQHELSPTPFYNVCISHKNPVVVHNDFGSQAYNNLFCYLCLHSHRGLYHSTCAYSPDNPNAGYVKTAFNPNIRITADDNGTIRVIFLETNSVTTVNTNPNRCPRMAFSQTAMVLINSILYVGTGNLILDVYWPTLAWSIPRLCRIGNTGSCLPEVRTWINNNTPYFSVGCNYSSNRQHQRRCKWNHSPMD